MQSLWETAYRDVSYLLCPLVMSGSTVLASQPCDTQFSRDAHAHRSALPITPRGLSPIPSPALTRRCALGRSKRVPAAPAGHWPSPQNRRPDAASSLNATGGYAHRSDWRMPPGALPELAMIARRQCANPRVNLTLFPAYACMLIFGRRNWATRSSHHGRPHCLCSELKRGRPQSARRRLGITAGSWTQPSAKGVFNWCYCRSRQRTDRRPCPKPDCRTGAGKTVNRHQSGLPYRKDWRRADLPQPKWPACRSLTKTWPLPSTATAQGSLHRWW